LHFGQDHDLILGIILPATVGHIANPLTYAAGSIGFRRPGITLFHWMPVGDMKLEIAGQVKQAEGLMGSDPLNAPNLSLASASALPGLEARVKLISKAFEVFMAGHWHRFDRNGVDDANAVPAARGSTMDTVAMTGGAKVSAGPLTVQAAGFVGKNLGTLIAFGGSQQTPAGQGDLREWGAWGQVGYNITPALSAWVLVGTDRPNYQDVQAIFGNAGKLQNVTTSAMIRYALSGITFGLEASHFHTKYVAAPADSVAASPDGVLAGNQLMLSGMYFF
jgi:hypothetical protein